ncbi:MAG: peptide ABC transporter substrate-binding protein [Chlamydiales bacterium]|nr:peptide ABC transporter substrate-binding protein [Chlamydiales bacterium]
MIVLQAEFEQNPEMNPGGLPVSFHPSFNPVYRKLQRWLARFPQQVENSIFNDLFLFYLVATKKYLDHRNATHLFRLVLSIHLMQKKLLRTATFAPHARHLEIRWIPTYLTFPFFTRPVLGCVVGFNIMDRYELFDEENVLLALQKSLPQLRIVRESSYCHTSQHKNLKMFYLEIEKKEGLPFSLAEQQILKNSLEEKIRKSIQKLSPSIFMRSNEEEIYKNVLVLSQEIQTIQDLPQVYIVLDQQTGKEIIFRVMLVYIMPFHRFSLKERFFDASFVPEKALTVKHIDNHPVEAHIFRIHLPRDASLLRSDGSLDFYSARQKVVSLVTSAIGEFRDYNGGILIKQQELLHQLKDQFPGITSSDLELLETFFYALIPLEKQFLLQEKFLVSLFNYFLEERRKRLLPGSFYSFKIYHEEDKIFLVAHGREASFKEVISSVLQEVAFKMTDIAYNVIDISEGTFFNCALLSSSDETEVFVHSLQEALHKWQLQMKDQQILRIGLEYLMVSLDPRIGGESVSGNVLRFLFEGLTRFDQNGAVENAVAESIEVSKDLKEYVFKLRYSQWNDGSPVTAYDFEYAWKKILSPDFKTSFASFFDPIKNAKDAKEGKVSLDQVGIQVIDARTLKVVLERPTHYFLQMTAHSVYSPIHRLIDQQHPQWPYQSQANYPCNGPFQLKINDSSQGYHLVRNPFYWELSRIYWDQIIMSLMTPHQAIHAFHKNEVDWVGSPFGTWHSFYVPGKEDRIVTYPNSLVYWCVFNTSRPPFHHPKLRRAFAYAIRRAELTASSFLPLSPAYSPLLPFYSGNQHPKFPEYDKEKARVLLQEALEELGISSKDFSSVTLPFYQKGIGEYIANCLKKQIEEGLGIKCHLEPLSWNTLFNRVAVKGDFQMSLMHWNSWIDDPIYTLNAFKYVGEEINVARWEHYDFKHFLDLSDQEINPFQRSFCLMKAEEVLCQEMPIIPLVYQPNQALVKKDLCVFYRVPCGPFNVLRSFKQKKGV